MTLTPDKIESIAEGIAREAHADQMYDSEGFFDAGGVWHKPRPYVEGHLVPGVRLLQRLGYGALYRAAFWLHDSIEDTDVTEEYLRNRCLPSSVIRPVVLMTKPPGYSDEDEAAYLQGIASDPIATADKFVDANINYANTVLMQPEVGDRTFFNRSMRYLRAIAYLGPLLPPPDGPEPRLWTPHSDVAS